MTRAGLLTTLRDPALWVAVAVGGFAAAATVSLVTLLGLVILSVFGLSVFGLDDPPPGQEWVPFAPLAVAGAAGLGMWWVVGREWYYWLRLRWHSAGFTRRY